MIAAIKDNLWKQFGASIDMLKNAISLWPDEQWQTKQKFFYNAYHVLVFLDYYLTFPAKSNFTSSLPFTLSETGKRVGDSIDDVIPDKVYTKQELLSYLEESREKCRQLIGGLTVEKLQERWIEPGGSMNYPLFELLLYNMRHVQHHVAQLNMMLRNEINDAPQWVGRTAQPL